MLGTRVLTALVAAPLFIGLIWWGEWLFAALIALLSVLAYREYGQMWNRKDVRVPMALGAGAAAALAGAAQLWGAAALAPVLLGATALLLLLPVFRPDDWNIRDAAISLAGVLYCGWLMAHWVLLRNLTPGGGSRPELFGFALPPGFAAIMFAFLCTWVTDTCAYFGGRLLGRHKLAPKVSPGKTIEGFVTGAAAAAVAGGLLSGWVLPVWMGGAALGLGVSLLGQVADLIESALKRYTGVKDSGTILPGHGGILDRFDSALFTLPLVYYVLAT